MNRNKDHKTNCDIAGGLSAWQGVSVLSGNLFALAITLAVCLLSMSMAANGMAAVGAMDQDRLNVDGGAVSIGHPVGASGLRMVYEIYTQLLGRAGERQLDNPRFGLTHNLGGFPFQNICSVAILGRLDD